MITSAQHRAAPGVLDLGIGHPDPRLLPAELIRGAVERALEDPESALQYGAERGPEALLESLAAFLTRETGVTTPPERIMVTSGISQALDLICTVFTRPGDVVLVEEPTYFLARDIFADHRLEVVGVPVDAEGVDVELLRTAAWRRRPAFFYTIPFFQNPSGASLSERRRRALLDVAHEHDLLVVSDEAYQLLAYAGAAPPSLASDAEPVLALGSFSKILAPGLRLGWIQGPTELVGRIERTGLVQSGGGLNPFAAAVAGSLLVDRTLDDHVDGLRGRYRERAEALTAALAGASRGRFRIASTGDAPGARVAGGYFLWLQVPGVDMAAASPVFRAAGVAYQPGERFSTRDDLGDHARLCFAYYDPDRLRDAAVRFDRGLAAAGAG